jgi:uncharacterized membrane protein YozB (DUF420 family)
MSEMPLSNQIDIIVQTIVLAIIIYGFIELKYRKKVKTHALAFAIATVINTLSVVIIMIPLFLSETGEIQDDFLTPHSIILSTHHLLGLIVLILSIFLIARWRRNKDGQGLCGDRWLMDGTFYSWLVTQALGYVLVAMES